jgi:hypothetical protein
MLVLGASTAQAGVNLKHAPGYGTCWGCASSAVKAAVREYVSRVGGPHAVCIAYRETGYNPSAISATDDHGLFQVHRASYHDWVDYNRMTSGDVIYSTYIFLKMSNWNRDLSPWYGGTYNC